MARKARYKHIYVENKGGQYNGVRRKTFGKLVKAHSISHASYQARCGMLDVSEMDMRWMSKVTK